MALSRSYRRRKNVQAAGNALEVNERWPRSEASSRLRTQPLRGQIGRNILHITDGRQVIGRTMKNQIIIAAEWPIVKP